MLAGELDSPGGIGHVAGEDRVERRGEKIGVGQEERALFRKEEGEPAVDVELRRIGLDLGEVGIERDVRHQVGGDPPAHGEPRLHLFAAALEAAVREVSALLAAPRRDRGVDLQVAARRDAFEALDLGELAEVTVDVPVLGIVADPVAEAARVDADRVEPPGLDAPGLREAERRERDRELDHVALGSQAAGGAPDGVPGQIGPAVDVVAGQVHLDAHGVDAEFVGAAAVVEGVEHDAHAVVGVDGIAIRQPAADLPGLGIGGPEGHVELLFAVDEQALGGHRRRHVLARIGLVVEGDRDGARPGGLVEHAVDRDGRVDPGDVVAGLGPGGGALGSGRLAQSADQSRPGESRPEEGAKAAHGYRKLRESPSSDLSVVKRACKTTPRRSVIRRR